MKLNFSERGKKTILAMAGVVVLLLGVSIFTSSDLYTLNPFFSDSGFRKASPLRNMESVAESVLLIGDTGSMPRVMFNLLINQAARIPEKTTVVFLGDNIYPDGVSPEAPPGSRESGALLIKQMNALSELGASAVVVPGNHDWDFGRERGWEKIKFQQQLVEQHLDEGSFLPRDACPGPAVKDLNKAIRVIVLDTQWWLHNAPKPTTQQSGCATWTEQQVSKRLAEVLRDNLGNLPTLVVNHHPLVSYGLHGKSWWCPSDLGCPQYRAMIGMLLKAFRENRPLICAAGHDHNLQIISGVEGCKYYLVSGGGSNYRRVSAGKGTLFAYSGLGLMRLDVLMDRRIRLSVIRPDLEKRNGHELLGMWLEIED